VQFFASISSYDLLACLQVQVPLRYNESRHKSNIVTMSILDIITTRLTGGDKDSSTMLTAAAVTVSLVAGYIYFDRRKLRNKPWVFLPGWLPLLGHTHLATSLPHIVEAWEGWAEKYAGSDYSNVGCFEMVILGRRFVIVSSEERAMEILRHRPYVVTRPKQLKECSNSLGSRSVFSAEGDQWKQEHKLVSPALNKANVQDYLSVLKTMAVRLVDKWNIAASAKESFSIAPDLSSMSADSIAKASMDEDFDFLNGKSQVAHDVNKIMTGFVFRGMAPFCYWNIPIVGQFLDGLGWSINRNMAFMDSVVARYEENGGDESKRTFLQKVYTLMHSSKTIIPRERLVGNVIGLFMAGTDTTSKALEAALYLLACDQALQKVLQEEADTLDLESATLQDFYSKIPRIKSFLHEVHRWYGVPGKETVAYA
jgi:cytochrome P450